MNRDHMNSVKFKDIFLGETFLFMEKRGEKTRRLKKGDYPNKKTRELGKHPGE